MAPVREREVGAHSKRDGEEEQGEDVEVHVVVGPAGVVACDEGLGRGMAHTTGQRNLQASDSG